MAETDGGLVGVYGWERADEGRGHSLARVARVEGGWLAHGAEVLVGDDTLTCSFRVLLTDDWSTREVDVTAVDAAGERSVALRADGERHWTVDGVADPALDGCVHVDVAATPLTNTFPIRQLAGLAVGGSWTGPVAWVDVPSLQVTRVEQTYRRLPDEPGGSGASRDGRTAWEYFDPTYGAFHLVADADGVVVDYEGFATRVHP